MGLNRFQFIDTARQGEAFWKEEKEGLNRFQFIDTARHESRIKEVGPIRLNRFQFIAIQLDKLVLTS